jgi:hypothetical protein
MKTATTTADRQTTEIEIIKNTDLYFAVGGPS